MLYAICRQPGLVIKPVPLTQQILAQLEAIFQAQEMQFLDGITAEIDFTGDWKPDPDELLILRNLPDTMTLMNSVQQNALAMVPLNAAQFATEGVVGLFMTIGAAPAQRILIQNFGPQQLMAGPGKLSLLFDGNVFRKITEPAFSIANNLVATLNIAGELKFKSYAMIRRILDVTPVFRAATDAELATFCAHNSLSITNTAAFINGADEVMRKQVLAISKSGVLAAYNVNQLLQQAQAIGFPLSVQGG
ncbi:hypothetical protein SH203_01871 [Brevundimonas sp. SH203]|uniref:hypothetical protein n=1 Tax=Brevundimonas sp. SH203 TaxID=345167 RepID=UPI0009D44627|nr:hypothetical protein [Brevundimonas sp. SH203]GAW41465.1 hypothetical protein SH203_01871 [Brevundimonas sp. SH203]